MIPEGNDTCCNRHVSDTPSLSLVNILKMMMDNEYPKRVYYSMHHFPQVLYVTFFIYLQ